MFDQIMSDRELEILALLAKGYSNKLIAQKLCIEPCTVSSHVYNAALKISDYISEGKNTRVRLARWYFEKFLKGRKNKKQEQVNERN